MSTVPKAKLYARSDKSRALAPIRWTRPDALADAKRSRSFATICRAELVDGPPKNDGTQRRCNTQGARGCGRGVHRREWGRAGSAFAQALIATAAWGGRPHLSGFFARNRGERHLLSHFGRTNVARRFRSSVAHPSCTMGFRETSARQTAHVVHRFWQNEPNAAYLIRAISVRPVGQSSGSDAGGRRPGEQNLQRIFS